MMTGSRGRICIITPGYISMTPRAVKEADALSEAGFDVRVVYSNGNLEHISNFDDQLVGRKKWRSVCVKWSPSRPREKFLYYWSKWRHFASRQAFRFLPVVARLSALGEGRLYPELTAAASAEEADIYIGHYPTGLAAAARAAKKWGKLFAYDAEDFHIGENCDAPKRNRIRSIESSYLPKASAITAVTDAIADRLETEYNISKPTAIQNVFPLDDRAKIDGLRLERSGPLSVYWFSQTIGPDRGLENAVRATGNLSGKAHLHLRGSISDAYRNSILTLAASCGASDYIRIHPLIPYDELLSRTAEHDVGLALEPSTSENRLLTVANKMFFYALCGLAIVATDTPGQRAAMRAASNPGLMCSDENEVGLTDALRRLYESPDQLRFYKQAASRAAEVNWNWEHEKNKVVNLYEDALNKQESAA